MATMKDVAKLAGVSLGTVSRVINKASGIKPSTLAKVEQAIRELNYIPDEYARGLKTQSSKTVALIIPTIWHPFFSEFAYFVEKSLDSLGYKMLLCNSDGNSEEEHKYIKMVKQNKIDAIIAITYSDIDQYIYSGIPFVSLDRYFKQKISYVESDNYQGGQIAAQELLKHGAKQLAYIGSHSKYPNDTMRRKKGFDDYLKEKNIEFFDIYLQEPVKDFEPSIKELLAAHPNIDGIFCHNDDRLLNVKHILEKLGYRIPDDIQLIGFDGVSSSKDWPIEISTIRQPVPKLAEGAVSLVMKKIKNPNIKNEIYKYPVTFREGNTTKNY
ncbi:LacI family transcriptional regulator [Lactobacillus colini]|uniref:LacI family transcriptional regulator n=1 Tax=Lactobacillus colini TaxID=1819254 RepID=A0ABS4MGJ2_9LACO|nr:LacI family DNA-binding transcriptional regulator [Lactobacillus colini]MBP2058829.1 LacI family transcriptional regulator [Lactobacillus colini]